MNDENENPAIDDQQISPSKETLNSNQSSWSPQRKKEDDIPAHLKVTKLEPPKPEPSNPEPPKPEPEVATSEKPKCSKLAEFWESKGRLIETPLYWMIMLAAPFLLIRLLHICSQIYSMYPVEQQRELPNYATNWNKDSIFGLSSTAYPDLPEPQNLFYVELVTGVWPANTNGCLCSDPTNPECFTKPRACNSQEPAPNHVQISNRGEQTIEYWNGRQIWVIRGRNTSMMDHFNGYTEDGKCKTAYKACPSDKLGTVFCISSEFTICPITSVSRVKDSDQDQDTGINTPDGGSIFISRSQTKTPVVEVVYSLGSLCIDRDQGTYLGASHELNKYKLFLNGKHSRRNFSCPEDKSGVLVAESLDSMSQAPNKIFTHHLKPLNLPSVMKVSLLAYNAQPWDQSCSPNMTAMLDLPAEANKHARKRRQSFYWAVFYLCLSLLCWTLTRLPTRFMRSELRKTTVADLQENTDKMNALRQETNKETLDNVLNVLESQKLKRLAHLVLGLLISVADIIFLVMLASRNLIVLIDGSKSLADDLLRYAGCAPGIRPLLLIEIEKLIQPQSLRKSFDTCFGVAVGLRVCILLWNVAKFFETDEDFSKILKHVQQINPKASMIGILKNCFWAVLTGALTQGVSPSGGSVPPITNRQNNETADIDDEQSSLTGSKKKGPSLLGNRNREPASTNAGEESSSNDRQIERPAPSGSGQLQSSQNPQQVEGTPISQAQITVELAEIPQEIPNPRSTSNSIHVQSNASRSMNDAPDLPPINDEEPQELSEHSQNH